ncbi:TetR/AcrR family transcriptional regulator [uncultured Amnibacterium sp.]|uniref:TetR/AcrR family transcriptional regulator n=1 Tax=uncultured Amnibacterium sp. TaxID=1631851 RepID=UPI0035CC6264
MPKVVDRAARRAEVVDAFLEVARRDGLAQASSRAIATELGVATGGLWHYFEDYDAVLLAAFDRIYHRTNERIGDATSLLTGLDAIIAMMREVLPVSPEAREEAAIVVGYWGRVAAIPALGNRQAAMDEAWRAMLLEWLEQAVLDGTLIPDAPIAGIADLLLSLSSSQQIRYVTRPHPRASNAPMVLVTHCLAPWKS